MIRFRNRFRKTEEKYDWSLTRYRIREEKYESGISKFFPQMQMVEGAPWHSLSESLWGLLNEDGKNWCDTIEDSRELIDRFRDSLKEDKLVKETIHKY